MTCRKIYGLLGYPVKHSFSPAMQNAAFSALEIDAEYRLFEVRPEELEDFLGSLAKRNIYGLNVTVPYKEKVLKFVSLDKESCYLKQIQAINTIVFQDGIWKGFNTDIAGFFRHIQENIDPANKRVAVLGAGGAARAVTYVLASQARDIFIYDIDRRKSEDIAAMIKKLFSGFEIKVVNTIEQLCLRDKDLLINATPIGMKETDPLLVKEEMLHKDLFVYDLIYNPPETKLLSLAKKVGARYANGLKMLLYQGTDSFRHWTGKEPPRDVMWQALQKELPECQR